MGTAASVCEEERARPLDGSDVNTPRGESAKAEVVCPTFDRNIVVVHASRIMRAPGRYCPSIDRDTRRSIDGMHIYILVRSSDVSCLLFLPLTHIDAFINIIVHRDAHHFTHTTTHSIDHHK
jgi:hypothetical protein